MFCRECGKVIPDGCKFCHHCGTDQLGKTTQSEGKSNTQNKTTSTVQQTANKPKSKGKKIAGIIMMVLGGLAVIGSTANGSCSIDSCNLTSIVRNALIIGMMLWGLVLWSENTD